VAAWSPVVGGGGRVRTFDEMPRRLEVVPAQVPKTRSLDRVRRAAASCTACHLYENATQTVFGRGARHPEVMVVGEQPGDREDRLGEAFVGPAGRVLDRALTAAQIDPATVWRTNAVKHFKWRPVSGKRRLHDRPDRNEIEICKPWLMTEIELLVPRVVVALGVTAATSLMGKAVTLRRLRGQIQAVQGHPLVVTIHPSLVLRRREEAEDSMRQLVDDLVIARELVRSDSERPSSAPP
jgi:uracil-DNA glycosylase